MHDHLTTPGSPGPVGDDGPVIEQVLQEASREIPLLTLAGCLTVAAEVLPYAIGTLRPVCSFIGFTGEHPIPTQFVWKNIETNEVYCHLRCAAEEAIHLAARITADERLLASSSEKARA